MKNPCRCSIACRSVRESGSRALTRSLRQAARRRRPHSPTASRLIGGRARRPSASARRPRFARFGQSARRRCRNRRAAARRCWARRSSSSSRRRRSSSRREHSAINCSRRAPKTGPCPRTGSARRDIRTPGDRDRQPTEADGTAHVEPWTTRGGHDPGKVSAAPVTTKRPPLAAFKVAPPRSYPWLDALCWNESVPIRSNKGRPWAGWGRLSETVCAESAGSSPERGLLAADVDAERVAEPVVVLVVVLGQAERDP